MLLLSSHHHCICFYLYIYLYICETVRQNIACLPVISTWQGSIPELSEDQLAYTAIYWKHPEFAVPSWVPSVAGSQTISMWQLSLT